jgi:hypothetical protein
MDVALPVGGGDECLQVFEDESEAEQVLRSVSEGKEGVRCDYFGRHVIRGEHIWNKSYEVPL